MGGKSLTLEIYEDILIMYCNTLCFKQGTVGIPMHQTSKSHYLLHMIGFDTMHSRSKDSMDVQVTEINGPFAINICNINLATAGELLIY